MHNGTSAVPSCANNGCCTLLVLKLACLSHVKVVFWHAKKVRSVGTGGYKVLMNLHLHVVLRAVWVCHVLRFSFSFTVACTSTT